MARNLELIRDTSWDIIVVGTGMGGATAGYALAQAGKSVLFIDKGLSRSALSLTGAYAETFFDQEVLPGAEHCRTLAAAGRESCAIDDASQHRSKMFIPYVGAGAGGSSALYGMALERFFPSDFVPGQLFSHDHAAAIPERWPIDYEELAPYYADAEALYGVRGTRDPLRPAARGAFSEPPPLTVAGSELFSFLQSRGFHPYRLPSACEFVPGCASCQGFLCPLPCKNDSARISLEPAVRDHGAVLLDRCKVQSLRTTAQSVTAVECFRDQQRFTLPARTVILAAGALATPALLLRSASSAWPDGVANQSGLVGRNLMRHLIDLYVVRPRTREPWDNRRKELAFNDFYVYDGVKLGSVQSFGRLPPDTVLAAHLQADIGEAVGSWAANAFRIAKPLVKRALKPMIELDLVLAGLVEDLPYSDNRVTLTPSGGVRIHYRMRAEAVRRVKLQRRLIADALRPYVTRLLKQAANNERIAHACGTCRFGNDPRTSVLDRNNRAHGMDNLYIVDSSFFPSSAGTNPALTIAANALRVAEGIA